MNNNDFDISMDTVAPSPKRQTGNKSTAQSTKAADKPKRKQKKEQASWVDNIKNNFQSDRTKLGIGITLMLIAVVMTIVLLGFLKTGALDQSLVESSSTIMQIADAPEGVENIGGAAGAKLAHILFVNGLGVGSFILAFYLFYLALALFKVVKVRFWSFSFKCIFTAIALSVIIGLFTYNSESFVHWGGNHGRYVNLWLYHISNIIGQYCVSIFLIGMLVVMYYHQLRKAYSNASTAIATRRQAMVDALHRTGSVNTLDEFPVDEEPLNEEEQPTPQQEDYKEAHGFSIDSLTVTDDNDPDINLVQLTQTPHTGTPIAIDEADSTKKTVFTIDNSDEELQFNIITRNPDEDDSENTVGTNFGDVTTGDFHPYDIRDDLSRYQFPTPELLIDRPIKESIDSLEQEKNKNLIVETLKTYNISITQINATIGPTVTRYEILPAEGVRIAQVRRLEEDIARSLAALGIRIIAPIPGTSNIGIEVPNSDPQTISMKSIVTSKKFRDTNMALPMALGKTIDNEIFIADLAKMPHLLVAGGTGQGKSVGLNCIIASLLYKKHPGELKFVLIDPKQLEFALYDKLEHHFLAKLPDEDEAIITDPMKAVATLSSICVEMDNRYSLLKNAGVRNIAEYNRKFTERRLNPQKGHRFMPYIVVIVDEFADLISTAGKDVLLHISRIVAKARAAGIHMIIATQRPSTDVITGVIKSNFLGRIAFRVMQRVDSMTILDQPGANRLIGRGDMIFSYNSTMERVQCAFIDTPEVEALVDYIDSQMGYPEAYILPEPERDNDASVPGAIDLSRLDERFDECAYFVVQNNTASTSSLQRRFSIGYNKAGKIMDQLEAAGIVSPPDGQKARSVLVDRLQLEDILTALHSK